MVIFLDCDGVINQLQPNYYIDEAWVKILGDIVDKLDASVVLSSTWRVGFLHNYDMCTPQIQKLRDVFEKYNIECIGRTKNIGDRQKEIEVYVKDHDIKDFLVLDDDKNEFHDMTNLYLVKSQTGLTKKDYKAITRLK